MGPGFESLSADQWPIGQLVKTAASHAVNIGSNPVWVTSKRALKEVYIEEWLKAIPVRVGIDCGEGPPVPIPNTEVKLTYADDSCLVTGRENR